MKVPIDKPSIMHYSSKYYDPAKAHEYYLNKRKLKPKRRTTKGMSEKQKEAWEYSKDNITEERKQKIEELRDKTNEARVRISAKIRSVKDKLDPKLKEYEAERAKLIASLKGAIEALRTEYENIYQREYDSIRSKVKAGKTKKVGSGKKATKRQKNVKSNNSKKVQNSKPSKMKKNIEEVLLM
jgi:hypothetical protein